MEFLFTEYSLVTIVFHFLKDVDLIPLLHVSKELRCFVSSNLSKRNPWLLYHSLLKVSKSHQVMKGDRIYFSSIKNNVLGLECSIFKNSSNLVLDVRSFYALNLQKFFILKDHSESIEKVYPASLRIPKFLTVDDAERHLFLLNDYQHSYSIELNCLPKFSLTKFNPNDVKMQTSKFSKLLCSKFAQLLTHLDFIKINHINVPVELFEGKIYFPDNRNRFFITKLCLLKQTFVIYQVTIKKNSILILNRTEVDNSLRPHDFVTNDTYFITQNYSVIVIVNMITQEKFTLSKASDLSLKNYGLQFIYFDRDSIFVGVFEIFNHNFYILNLVTQKLTFVSKVNDFWNYNYTNHTIFICHNNLEHTQIKLKTLFQ